MEYLVEMELADSARSKTPEDGIALIEQLILPTLDQCGTLAREKRILAGGPVSGAIRLAFIVQADGAQALDEVVTALPVWPRMVTTVTPLTTWSDRATLLRPRLERLRAAVATAAHGEGGAR